jgi:two-component system sensor histidine kinase ChiS
MPVHRSHRGVLSILGLLVLVSCSAPGPRASGGVLDLTGWNFAAQGPARLDGQWDFFYNRLPAFPANPNAPGRGSIPVPGYWNEADQGSFPTLGAATYQIRLLLPPEAGSWMIKVPEVACSWRLSVDGQVLAENGTASTAAGTYRAYVKPRYVVFGPGGGERLIQLYVVNGTDRVGGIRDSVLVGPADLMGRMDRLEQVDSAFFLGGLVVMTIFNLVIFFLQRQRKANLWLSAFSVFIALRTMVTGPTIILDLIPGLSFETMVQIAYLTIFGSVASFAFYLRTLFPRWWPARVFLPFLLYTALFAILLFVLPIRTYAEVFLGFYDVPLGLMLFVYLGVSWLAMRHNHEDGTLVFSGMVFLLLGALNDIVYQFVPLPEGYVLGRFLFVFLVFNTFVLSRQLAKDYLLTQRQSGELRKLDKLKDDFLARVTHELRTPLNGMIGILDAFRMGDFGALSDRQAYHLGLLEASSRRLTGMVNTILDFNSLKKHQLVSDPRPILLKQSVDFLLPSFYGQMKPGVALVNRLSDELPAVLGDEAKLEQVLHNLLRNALQHTDRGTVTVDAELKDHQVILLVRDTGRGISPDKMAELFSPFHQTEDIDTRPTGGLGLGLAISRPLIEQMGGHLEIHSQEGVGTTVLVGLPVCPPSKLQYFQTQRLDRAFRGEPAAAPIPEAPADAPPVDSGATILIVDDEPVNLLVLKSFLTRYNYRVLEASSGPEALEKLSQNVVDLMILDIMMPGMSGYEVCTRVRERFTPARLPVLLLTAKNQVDDLLKGYKVGASDFLTKPFQREELKARMDLHLQVSRAARSGKIVAEKG